MSINIEDIKPNLLKKISKIAKNKEISEEVAINKIAHVSLLVQFIIFLNIFSFHSFL